jgi:hypothetical protein
MPVRPLHELRRLARRFVLLVALPCAAAAQQQPTAPTLTLSSHLVLSHQADWFGGFSGAEVSPDGSQITIIGDRGRLLHARLLRDEGRLSGLEVIASQVLTDAAGRRLRAPNRQGNMTDAEGLARDPAGRMAISFEGRHRVMRLHPTTGRTLPLADNDLFATLPLNSGLEALAYHPDGTLYAVPEAPSKGTRSFPIFTLRDGQWRVALTLPQRGPFRPVGADFAPDGTLYLLERALTPLGLRSRIRRFNPTHQSPEIQTLLTTPPARYDNLEALTLWRDPQGATRLILLSDDNFSRLQRSEIVEFTVAE